MLADYACTGCGHQLFSHSKDALHAAFRDGEPTFASCDARVQSGPRPAPVPGSEPLPSVLVRCSCKRFDCKAAQRRRGTQTGAR